MLRFARNDGRTRSPPLRRNIPNPLAVSCDIFKAIFEVHAFGRSRLIFGANAGPPFLRGSDRPRSKPAAAVRADVIEFFGRAGRTERAFIAANARIL